MADQNEGCDDQTIHHEMCFLVKNLTREEEDHMGVEVDNPHVEVEEDPLEVVLVWDGTGLGIPFLEVEDENDVRRLSLPLLLRGSDHHLRYYENEDGEVIQIVV